MKRLGRMWMVAVVMGVVGGSAQGKYGGGTGEPNDPYQIWDANDMQAIGADPCDWDKCFILMADIDLGQFDGKDGREEFNTIGRSWYDDYGRVLEGFSGVFDGNGRTVYNLTVYGYGDLETGLFGVLNGGTIRDLGLVDPNVSGLGEVPMLKCLTNKGQ